MSETTANGTYAAWAKTNGHAYLLEGSKERIAHGAYTTGFNVGREDVTRLERELGEARAEAERRSNVVHQSHQPYPLMYGTGRAAELLAETPPVKGCFDPLCAALAPKEAAQPESADAPQAPA